ALDEKELDRWPTVTAAGGYTRSLSQINPGPDQRNLAQSYRAGFALDEKELDRWPTVTAAGGYTRSLSQINPGPDQR
ncbi:hypothetical protein CKW47_21270, partial [Bordetella pertussis]